MPKGYLPYSRGPSRKMFSASTCSRVKKQTAALIRNRPKKIPAPQRIIRASVRAFTGVQATAPEGMAQASMSTACSRRASMVGFMSWQSTWKKRDLGRTMMRSN